MNHNLRRSASASAILFSILAALLLGSCVTNQFAGSPLETVESLDVQRYLGQWYEVARYQKGFEKNIFGSTAEYSLREDGRIKVVNSGYKNSLDGPFKSVEAVAWRPDDQIPGALKVQFFNLFTSDYLVFGLNEENYQWALVGSSERDSLWFLSRTHEVPEEILARMRVIAEEQGFDLTDLFYVPQKLRR
jgi:apolipoprotein D and lipocalin family protein